LKAFKYSKIKEAFQGIRGYRELLAAVASLAELYNRKRINEYPAIKISQI